MSQVGSCRSPGEGKSEAKQCGKGALVRGLLSLLPGGQARPEASERDYVAATAAPLRQTALQKNDKSIHRDARELADLPTRLA